MKHTPTDATSRPTRSWWLIALIPVFILILACGAGSQALSPAEEDASSTQNTTNQSAAVDSDTTGAGDESSVGSEEEDTAENRFENAEEVPATSAPLPTSMPDTADTAAGAELEEAETAAEAPAGPVDVADPGATGEGSIGRSGDGLEGPVAPAPDAADLDSSTDEEPAEEAVERPFVGGPAPLRAGEINDNEQFGAYLDYLASFTGYGIRTAEITERYFITVLDDNQQPLLDATVRIYDEQNQQLFVGRTYAGGQTLFLPGMHSVSNNVHEFHVVAEKNGASAETTMSRDAQERVELAIPGAQPPAELQLDVVFLLDTTGSMADELARIQETIDSIAQRIDTFEPRPSVRFGLVAYRDEGDEYITQDYDFTSDVGLFREALNELDADGGGDTPEALDEGLHNAIHDLQWSDNAVRLIFLVADAGPHVDRDLGYNYLTDAQQAVAQGVKIYPIAASNTDTEAEYVFRQLAQQTLATFIFLTYQSGESSGAPGDTTTLEAGEQGFTVERLDDLIVQVIERELAAAIGVR